MTSKKIKIIYLLFYMGFAFWRAFYNIFLEEDGFTGAQIGIINSLTQAIIFFVVPFAGYFADKKGIRPTLILFTIGTAFTLFFLGQIHSFPLLLGYIILVNIFYQPLGPLSDAIAVQYVQMEKKSTFGKLRLWGSLGWAIAASAGGYLFTIIDIKYIFPISAITLLIALPYFIFPLKRKRIYKAKFEFISFKQVINNKPLLVFMAILFIYGILCSPINSFLNLYFRELGTSNTIIGLAYAIQALSELPFFFIGDALARRYGSYRIISLAIATMALRLVLYWLFPSSEIALLLGLLQGITLSFFFVGAVDLLHRLLPDGLHATAQSIIWGLYVGLGQTIGNPAIGMMKDSMGMIGVMKYFGAFCILLFAFSVYYFQKQKKAMTIQL